MNTSTRITKESITDVEDSISVVIPTYARPEQLPVAIKTVLNQSENPTEIIVSDNDPLGSASWICDEQSHTSIVYVNASAIRGASHARNSGAREARGEWIAFLDDDDRWSPRYLVNALERGKCQSADMVLTPMMRDYSGDVRPGKNPREGVPFETLLRDGNFGITGSNIFIRKRVFRSLGGFDRLMPASEDIDLFVRFKRGGFKYAVTPEALVVQSIHDGQRLSQTSSMSLYRGTKQLKEKHARFVSSSTRRKLSGRVHERGFHAEKGFKKKLVHATAAALSGNTGPFGDSLRAVKRGLVITRSK